MDAYYPEKIGRHVAWGRSHSVYRYGENEVIKFPRLTRFIEILLCDGLKIRERLTRDNAVCERYLGDFFLPTRIVEDPAGRIAVIQPYVKGHYLSKEDLKDETLRARFEELVRRYESMVSAGYEVDLIGQGGALRRCLSNVLVLDDGSMRLFDATAVALEDIPASTYLARLIIALIRKRQRSTLRFLLSR